MKNLLKVLKTIRKSIAMVLIIDLMYMGMIILLFIKPVYIVTMKDLVLGLTIAFALCISNIVCNISIKLVRCYNKSSNLTTIEIISNNLTKMYKNKPAI